MGMEFSILIVLRHKLCVSSQKSLTAPIFILCLGLHPRLSDWDTGTQKCRSFIFQGYGPQSAESRTWVWIFLAACLRRRSHASQTHSLTELPCPFQIHLDITDGIASHCFATSLVWLSLLPFPYSPRPAFTNKIRTLILAPGYVF